MNRFVKWLTIKHRAYKLGVEITNGDSPIPVYHLLPKDDKHLWRSLVRLKRLADGCKAFRQRKDVPLYLYSGTEQEGTWYLEWCGCIRK
ncbi:MAG: hypothetical protein WC356_02175 [Candidatus Micrarchaeia archaeon]|jgi:hypothetical protein